MRVYFHINLRILDNNVKIMYISFKASVKDFKYVSADFMQAHVVGKSMCICVF